MSEISALNKKMTMIKLQQKTIARVVFENQEQEKKHFDILYELYFKANEFVLVVKKPKPKSGKRNKEYVILFNA